MMQEHPRTEAKLEDSELPDEPYPGWDEDHPPLCYAAPSTSPSMLFVALRPRSKDTDFD